MTFDNETDKQFILKMFASMNFPGNILDFVYNLKLRVTAAGVVEPEPKEEVTL